MQRRRRLVGAVLCLLALAGCGSRDDPHAGTPPAAGGAAAGRGGAPAPGAGAPGLPPAPPASVAGPDRVSVSGLGPGDCLAEDVEAARFSAARKVSCEQAHDSEVYAVLTHSAGPGEAFPGEQVLALYAEQQCLPRFPDYVGRDAASSRFAGVEQSPTAGSWAHGDREILCLLFDIESDQKVGSARGSGL